MINKHNIYAPDSNLSYRSDLKILESIEKILLRLFCLEYETQEENNIHLNV